MAKLTEIERAVNQRVYQLYEQLVEQNVVSNISDFCEKAGLDRSNFSKYFKDDDTAKELKTESVVKLTNAFGVNADWLLNGKGEPLKNQSHVTSDHPEGYSKTPNAQIIVATQDLTGNTTIPFVNRKAAANYLSGYQSQEYFEHLDSLVLPRVLIKEGQHMALEVVGDSMELRFKDGEIVVCQLVERGRWEEIPDNNACVVVSTTHGLQFKRVKVRLKEHGWIRCKSDNRRHEPFNVFEEDLIGIWRFQLKISAEASNMNEDLFRKVDNLEDELADLKQYFGQTLTDQQRIIEQLLEKKPKGLPRYPGNVS